jgi:hypothetical protein
MKHNAAIRGLPKEHPARRFLEAFLRCRKECVGREYPPPGIAPVDQAWFSAVDQKQWSFSKFAYMVLAFDLQLDGWVSNAPALTESERQSLECLPMLRVLMAECHEAAVKQNNSPMFPLIRQVQELLDLWEECIRARAADHAPVDRSIQPPRSA